MSKRSLVKSTGVIALATAVSRVLGFVRDIVMANFFGTSMAAQAFVVAFRIPNSLRDLVGEGAMNAAIVPVLSGYAAGGDRTEFLRVSRVLCNIFLAVLVALTAAGIALSPLIVRLIAPGFTAEPEKFALTVTLNRVIFPYLVLIGLTAYAMGVLNTIRHFAVPAIGPAVLNLVLIVSAVALCPSIGVYGLIAGVLLGGALQLAISIAAMYANGLTFDPAAGMRHPAVSRIGRLLVPRVMGSAIYQINVFINTILASLASVVGSGGVAALYYANRLIQFPLAIFGLALAQAALPKMSQEFIASDIGRFKETLSFSLRGVFLVMIPASIGLAVLGGPIVRLLFERGEFTAYSTAITADALFFYSLGLFSYGGVKLMVTSFYAMHDTMTPVKTAAVAVVLNVALSVALMGPLKLGGLALATSVSVTFNFVALFVMLRRRIGDFGTASIVLAFGRIVLAGVTMGACLQAVSSATASFGLFGLAASIVFGIGVFIVAGYLVGVREIRDPFVWISKRS